jgi:DNA-binding transcriptional regulator GbsR (MarR family)
MGKIDKTFKKGRYSNMFDADVGFCWKNLLTRNQFEDKWEEEFNNNKSTFKFEWK